MGALVALVVLGMTAAFAANASAFPTQTTLCRGCHNGPGATIATTLVSTVGNSATYSVSAPGADAIAVFNGSTKLATIIGASGQFSVPTGGVYTIFAVTGPTTTDGLGTASVSPVAAPADVTAPVTTSDAVATYVSSATINLTATDAGSGVASTYYVLDGGAQTAGTSVSVSLVGSHTLEFWSVDVAGNVEAHNTVGFTITAPVPDPAPAPAPGGETTTSVSIRASYGHRHESDGRDGHRFSRGIVLSGRLAPAAEDLNVSLYVQAPDSDTWSLVDTVPTNLSEESATASWAEGFTPTAEGSYRFQVKFDGSETLAASQSRVVTVSSR
jgi:hypothetical protein